MHDKGNNRHFRLVWDLNVGHLSVIVLVLFISRDRKIMRVGPCLPLSRTEHKLWVHVDVLESRNLADELSLGV